MAELKTYSSTSSAERTKAVPCPICASSHTARVWTTQGVLFVRCAVCGLWRQNPQPVQEDLLLRYGDEYLAYEMDRQLDYRRISLQSLAQAGLHADRAGGSLLEVGCATGALLAAFRDGGWDVVGVEAGAAMAEYARKHWNIDVRHGTLESSHMQAESVDAFVATHLIEHLNDPRSFLREARRIMKADAALYLITPNADGFQARLKGQAWRSAIRDHLYLFSVRTLKAMLVKEGFRTEYVGTWGGWPLGMEPHWIKAPLDRAAKRFGCGDVMVLRARKEEL